MPGASPHSQCVLLTSLLMQAARWVATSCPALATTHRSGRGDVAKAASPHRGTVRPNAPAGNQGRVGGRHASSAQASQPVPLLQLVVRGDPAGGDDVRALPALLTERGGPAVRARHRHLTRDGQAVVEQVRAHVCGRHTPPAGVPDAGLSALAVAPGRDVREVLSKELHKARWRRVPAPFACSSAGRRHCSREQTEQVRSTDSSTGMHGRL